MSLGIALPMSLDEQLPTYHKDFIIICFILGIKETGLVGPQHFYTRIIYFYTISGQQS
jgi:hypothetical protein